MNGGVLKLYSATWLQTDTQGDQPEPNTLIMLEATVCNVGGKGEGVAGELVMSQGCCGALAKRQSKEGLLYKLGSREYLVPAHMRN